MIYLLTSLGCIGGLLFGYDTGIISGALVLIGSDFNLTDVEQSLVVSICVAGAFASAIFAGTLGDRFGRRPVVLASSIAFILGAILMAVAKDFRLLLVGRFIVGLGVGSASLIVPVYLSECAPTEHRGSLIACVNVSVTLGQLIACVVAGLLSETEEGWRYMLGIAAIPALLQLIGFLLWVPESPRYLIQKGMADRGTAALIKLRGMSNVESEVQDIMKAVQSEAEALEREATLMNISTQSPLAGHLMSDNKGYLSLEEKSTATPNVWSLLRKTTTIRALILGAMLQSGQQVGGINTVMYFGATIFTLGGSSHITAIWLTVGLSACNWLGSCISFYLQDRLGRRSLTLISMLGVSLSLFCIAAAFFATRSARSDAGQSSEGSISSTTWLIFSVICMYLICFGSGMGSTPWTVCAEIYPTAVRGAATSITTSVNWVSNFIMSMSFLSIVSACTAEGAFLLYSILSLCYALFYYFYLPETKGVPLENIARLFEDNQWGRQRHFFVPASSLLSEETEDMLARDARMKF